MFGTWEILEQSKSRWVENSEVRGKARNGKEQNGRCPLCLKSGIDLKHIECHCMILTSSFNNLLSLPDKRQIYVTSARIGTCMGCS